MVGDSLIPCLLELHKDGKRATSKDAINMWIFVYMRIMKSLSLYVDGCYYLHTIKLIEAGA